jgi:hypothetical protein
MAILARVVIFQSQPVRQWPNLRRVVLCSSLGGRVLVLTRTMGERGGPFALLEVRLLDKILLTLVVSWLLLVVPQSQVKGVKSR